MKKVNLVFTTLSIVAIATVLVVSCSKKRIQNPTLNEYDATNTNSYLDSKQEEEQEFIIDSAGSCPLVGKLGTKNLLR